MINNQVNFRVQSPNGKIWDVPESNLDEAIKRRGEIVQRVQSPDGNIWDVPESKMQIALKRGGKLYEEPPSSQLKSQESELSFSDRLLQYGRGVSEIPAGVVDIATNIGSQSDVPGIATDIPVMIPIHEPDQKNKNLQGSNLTGKVHEKFNEFAGKDITPKDTLGRVLNTAGNFSMPVPGSGVLKGAKASVEGAKQIISNLARNTTIGAGGAVALEGTKDYSLTNEGTIGRHVEDFVKSVFGMSLADKGLSAVKKSILEKSSKELETFVDHSNKFIKEESNEALEGVGIIEKVAGKALSIGAKPNKVINELAKKHDIELPFQVALGGRFQKFVSNTALKSIFTAEVYDNVIHTADQEMINSVKQKLNNISSELVSGEIASSRAKEFLKQESKDVNEQTKKYYAKSDSFLKPTDAVLPQETIKTILSMLKIPALKAPVPGPQAKPIANYLKDVGEKLGFLPPKNNLKEFEDSPDFLRKVIEAYSKKAGPVPVESLVGQLRATEEFTKFQRDIPGLKNLFNGLAGAISKDIKTTTNKEFLGSFENANQYFQQNQIDRIRTDLARSLMNGEIPKEAFEYMSAAPEIRKLGHILGESKNGKEIFSSLKRAKLEQILTDKIIDASGTISYSKLSNMFLKNPENQAVLKELLGGQYNGIHELAEISQEFVKSGKEFGNPSGTSFALRDVQGIQDIIKIGLNAAGSIGAGVALTGLGGIVEGPLAINALSRLVSNKKYIDTALKYAEAAKNKKVQSKNVLENRLMRLAKSILEEGGDYPQAILPTIKPTEDEK